ncbi:neuronal acetylcholine receptor subunit alpha-10-like [Glandiceps talaboti]
MSFGHGTAICQVICLACTFLCTQLDSTEGFDSAASLVGSLLKGYPKYTRPVRNSTTITNVTHRVWPIQILDVDERNQILTMKVWLRLGWTDEFMVWDPSDYGGLDTVIIPVKELWQPDITLYGSVSREFDRHLDTDAVIFHDGIVSAPQPIIYETTCAIDATYFPFDEQACELKFGSWSYDDTAIDMVAAHDAGDTKMYIRNGEWELIGIFAERNEEIHCCPDPFIDVTYTVQIRRRSLFYIFNLVLPAVLLFILVLVGFYLPSDCGERMTLFVTSMLALMVFLTLVSDYMPPTSESTPYLQSYLITTIGLVAVSSILTAFTVNMHFQPHGCPPVPRWMRLLVFKYLASFVFMSVGTRKYLNQSAADGQIDTFNIYKKDDDKCTCQGSTANVNATESNGNSDHATKSCVHKALALVNDSTIHEDRVHEWQAAAKVIDRVFLLGYAVIFFCLSTGILSYLFFKSH